MAVLGSTHVRGIGLAGSRALIARIVAVFALLFCAVLALRGYIPGIPENSEDTAHSGPAAVSVALMPVLLTVSIVVLLAGVIASQHRLPLAMPDLDTGEPARPRRLGRFGVVVLFLLAVTGVLAAIAFAVCFIGFQRALDPVPPVPDQRSAPTRPAVPPGTAPDEPILTGPGSILAAATAGTLVAVAVTGLVVVSVDTRRRERKTGSAQSVNATEDPGPTDTESLVKAAKMGLAAMNAPGQDPRAAIIACYVAMEHGLIYARGAAPLASDTPMEVLARAFEHGALHDGAARELVALFEEARFSPHSMWEWQRMRAEQLLRVVLSDLQGAPPSTDLANPLTYPPGAASNEAGPR